MFRLPLLIAVFSVTSVGVQAKHPELPTHDQAVAALASLFVETPKQIPATVVDVGQLKFIPYLSFRVGEDRELNVYGDPAAPACVEIGLYRSLLLLDREKER